MAIISVLLMVWSSAALAAEVRVSQLPEDAYFVQATEGGALWAVTDKLWRINMEGSAEVVSTPMRVDLIAWAGSKVGLWIASPTGAALLEPSGEWKVISTEQSPGVHGLVPLGGKRVAVVRDHPGAERGDEVLFVDAGLARVTRTMVFPDCTVNPVESDGNGGFWAELDWKKRIEERPTTILRGLLHMSNGKWTAWTTSGTWPKEFEAPAGVELAGTTPTWFTQMQQDGALFAGMGGAGLFATEDAIYRVSPEGRSEAVVSKTSVGGSLPTTPDSVAKDLSGHGLLMVRFEEPDKLTLAHWENGELHTERIPLLNRIAKDDSVVSTRMVAASGGVTWVLLNGALAMKRNGAWTVFSSTKLGAAEEPLPPGPEGTEISEISEIPEPTEAREARKAREATLTTVGWAVVGGSLSLAIGTFSGSAVRGERRWATGAQTLAGSLLGTLPGLEALRYSPLTSHWGPGMGGALAMASCVGGFTLQLGATALGTWATGELGLSPTRNPWASLGGAFLGALVGAAIGLGVDALLQKVFPYNEALRWSFAIGLAGSGATVGYQWLGGGPRNGQ
jgi:hypothetical protein